MSELDSKLIQSKYITFPEMVALLRDRTVVKEEDVYTLGNHTAIYLDNGAILFLGVNIDGGYSEYTPETISNPMASWWGPR